MTNGRRWRPLLALGVFVLLAMVHTWPLVRDPAHLSRVDNGDGAFNIWAVAWVAHTLPRAPLHVFDANIFYPERLTLGYSEAMLLQGLLAVPVAAAGGTPVLAYSLVLLAGFALTGWAFCLLVWRWTGSWSAGYVAGSLAAFNSHVLVRLAHLQTQHVEFVALMLFALDRLLASGRARDAILLGVGFALQGLTSVYLLVFSTWLLLFASASRLREWWTRERAAAMLVRFAIAAVVAIVLLGPYLFAYFLVHRLTGFERIAKGQFSASWVNYLASGSRLHWFWSRQFYERASSPTFPGVVATVLAGVGLTSRDTRSDRRVRMCTVAALGCAAVSMLPMLPFYPVIHQLVPLFRMVRVPAYLGQFVLLMIAVIAGFGVASLQRRWERWGRRGRWGLKRAWPVVATGLVLCVNLEALRAPVGWTLYAGVPPVYDRLAPERDAVVVELPFYPPRAFFANSSYMLNSTRHWRPMLNGYAGFLPASYTETYRALLGFPNYESLAALHQRGVTHIVVHEAEFKGAFGRSRLESIGHVASLESIAHADGITIFRLKRD